MKVTPKEFKSTADQAQSADIQIFYKKLKDAHTSIEALTQIIYHSENLDEVEAAGRLWDLIQANKKAGLKGNALYLEHDSIGDVSKKVEKVLENKDERLT